MFMFVLGMTGIQEFAYAKPRGGTQIRPDLWPEGQRTEMKSKKEGRSRGEGNRREQERSGFIR